MSIDYFLKWSFLNSICRGLIGRVLFSFSLLPGVISIVSALKVIGLNDGLEYKLVYIGSIVFLIGYALCVFFTPDTIKKFSNMNLYQDWCLQKTESLNFQIEFGSLEKCDFLKKNLNKFDNVFSQINEYLPIEKNLEPVRPDRAVMIYSTAKYQCEELSRMWIRLISSFLLFVGIILMQSIIISQLTTLFRGG